MKTLFLFLTFLCPLLAVSPNSIIVLYNDNLPDSVEIAQYYAKKRGIPSEHLVGLPMSDKGAISIADYETSIATPLRAELDKRNLWKRSISGRVTTSNFDTIVTIYGVPYKTVPTKLPAQTNNEGKKLPRKSRPLQSTDAASVDSELTTLLMPFLKKTKLQANPYFNSSTKFTSLKYPNLILVGRIDSPSPEICLRMIDDAIEIEKTGLLGKCYLDKAFRRGAYKLGDDWLDNIASVNNKSGIPTVTEETKDLFFSGYPMEDAALYYGWYSRDFSGPFRNEFFKLKKGSIVTHIHSFSSQNLRSTKNRWTGPILQRGAAATLGNVHEPSLNLTTYLDLFHKNLIAGKTLLESAWAATPAISWHNVVIGDPLYRPFANTVVKGVTVDKDYQIIKGLAPINTRTKFKKLQSQAERRKSHILHEASGLLYTTLEAHDKSIYHFREAERLALDSKDQLRNILHQIAYYRKHKQKDRALLLVKANLIKYQGIPEGKSLVALKNILDPPAPAPAGKESPKKKAK